MKKQNFIGLMFFVLTLAAFSYAVAQDNAAFDPAPPNAELLDTKEFTMGGRQYNAALYGTDDAPETLVAYYRSYFSHAGFQKTIDHADEKRKRHVLRFKQGDFFVGISVRDKQGKAEVVVARFLQRPTEAPPEQAKLSLKDSMFALSDEDTAGEDLSSVPRPPDAVRLADIDRGKYSILLYSTALNIDSLVDFYKAQMPAKNWALRKETDIGRVMRDYKGIAKKRSLNIKPPFLGASEWENVTGNSHLLYFTDGPASAEIIVLPDFVGKTAGSIVWVNFSEGGE